MKRKSNPRRETKKSVEKPKGTKKPTIEDIERTNNAYIRENNEHASSRSHVFFQPGHLLLCKDEE